MPILTWILGNPIKVLSIAVAAFVVFQFFEVRRLRDANADMKTEITQLQTDQKELLKNVGRIDALELSIANTRSTQTIIRERVNNVPVLAEDRPFVNDPGMLDRADIMRDAQERYKSTLPNK